MLKAALIAVGLGIVGLIFSFWLLGENLSTAWTVPTWAYAVGLGLAAVGYAAGALRLVILARRAGENLGFIPALRAYAVGLLMAALTPGSAGQAPAVALSLVRGGMSAATAWTINVRVWILDLVFLAWSLPLSILVLGRATRLLSGAKPELIAGAVFLGAGLMVALLLFRLRWLISAAAWLTKLPGIRRWRARLQGFLERLNVTSANLMPAPWYHHVLLHLTSFTVYFTTYFTFFVVVVAMRPATTPLVAMASAQVPTVASSLFPTPGGTGLLEVGTASLMRLNSPSAGRVDMPIAPAEPSTNAEGFGGAVGAAGLVAATDDAKKAEAGVAAAILAWRLLTYYLRMAVGALVGGALLRSRRDS